MLWQVKPQKKNYSKNVKLRRERKRLYINVKKKKKLNAQDEVIMWYGAFIITEFSFIMILP